MEFYQHLFSSEQRIVGLIMYFPISPSECFPMKVFNPLNCLILCGHLETVEGYVPDEGPVSEWL